MAKMDMLTLLPEEIAEQVLYRLNLNEILNCSLVSRTWFNLINSCNTVWKHFCNQRNVKFHDWNYNIIKWVPCTCDWKKCFLNFKKTVYNWKNNIFKEFNIVGRRLHQTVYDNTTLIVYNSGDVDVYRLSDNRLEHLSKLPLEGDIANCWLTNTLFVVVICRTRIVVYRLVDFKYVLSYVLRVDVNGMMTCSNTLDRIYFLDHELRLEPTGRCLIRDTFYYCNKDVVFAWQLKTKSCLLKVNNYQIISAICDAETVYICYNVSKIDVYNDQAKLIYRVCVDFKICKLLLNNQLLIALGEEYFSSLFLECGATDRVTICERETGKVIINGAVMFLENAWIYKHGNVIIQLETSPLYNLIAQDLNSGYNLWRVPMIMPKHPYLQYFKEEQLFCNNIDDVFITSRRTMVDEREDDELVKSCYNLQICDGKNGKRLYSVQNVKCDTLLNETKHDVFVAKDILMFADARTGRVTIRLYR